MLNTKVLHMIETFIAITLDTENYRLKAPPVISPPTPPPSPSKLSAHLPIKKLRLRFFTKIQDGIKNPDH